MCAFSEENLEKSTLFDERNKEEVDFLVLNVKNKVVDIVNFANVGLAPNSMAIIAACNVCASILTENPTTMWLNIGVSLLNMSASFVKYKEYKKLKSLLEKHGFQERIVKPKSLSWCQRHLSQVAAKQTGHEQELKDFYLKEGHKLWHILPKRQQKSVQSSKKQASKSLRNDTL